MTTARILGNNGLLLNSSQEYKEQVANELFRLVSVGRAPILSRTLTTPPTSGLTADSFYIVPAGASGAWAGKTNQIACPAIGVNGQPVSGAWKFYEPFAGLNVSLVSGGTFFYDGDSWATAPSGGDMLAAEYDSDGDMKVDAAEVADSIAGNPADDTFYGKESGNKGFFNFFPKVRATVLTGLSTATGGAVAATDTVLGAIGKLQKQVSDIVAGGVGVTDGDKGDITVSGTGTNWTIDNDAVTLPKLQNIATNRLLGRSTSGSGDVEEIQLGTGLSLSGGTLSSTGTGTGGAITVQDEWTTLTINATSLNFTGAGVTATNSGGAVTVSVPGGGGSFVDLNYRNLAVQYGAAAYFPLDETSGTTASNLIAPANTGDYQNSPTLNQSSLLTSNVGKSVSFSRASSQGVLINNVGFTSVPFTIEGMIKLPDTSQQGVFFGIRVQAGSNKGEFYLGVGNNSTDSNGNELIGLSEFAGFYETNTNLGTRINHLAMTVSNSLQLTIYLNGTQVFQGNTSGSEAITGTNGNGMIAYQPGSATRWVTALIDEVSYYPSVLSSGQIALRSALAFSNISTNRELLTADRTYFVGYSGASDSNDGLTTGSSFATWQKAIDVAATLDLGIYAVTIQIQNGTYTEPIALKYLVGAGKVTIKGNSNTPANVVLSTTTTAIIASGNISNWIIDGIEISSSSGNCLEVNSNASVEIQNLRFGNAGFAHIAVSEGGLVRVAGNYTIAGNSAMGFHVLAQFSGFFSCAGRTITLVGTPTFGSTFGFASSIWQGSIDFVNSTFLGSANGRRYFAEKGGYIRGTVNGSLPGNSEGVANSPGFYSL
jgi:hypothetical protein